MFGFNIFLLIMIMVIFISFMNFSIAFPDATKRIESLIIKKIDEKFGKDDE